MESQNQITTPPPISNEDNTATFQRSYSFQFSWKMRWPLTAVVLFLIIIFLAIYYFNTQS